MKKDDTIYLKHILNEIIKIENSIKNQSKKDFLSDLDVQDAVIRRIEIIGEATKNISMELRENYPNIPWKKISGTRDVLIHSYFSVDLDLVWNIINNEITVFKKQILNILNQ